MTIHSQDIEMHFDIEKCHANNEKLEITHYERNRTNKRRKDQNARRKENILILGKLEGDSIKQVELKEKVKKRASQENEGTIRNQTI